MKNLLTIYFLLQFSFGFTQCIEGDCENGTGTYLYKKGEYKGYGSYRFKNGDKYVGEFKDNQPDGQGTFTSLKGQQKKYIGKFKDGDFSGEGILILKNGNKFIGKFKDGDPVEGVFTFKNGKVYKGEFKYGEFNGQGILTLKNGKVCNGEFRNGKFKG